MSISFLSALAAGRVRTSTRTPFAFTRRGSCVPSRSAQGRRMLFVRLVNRAFQAIWRSHHDGRKQARDSGHSPFRGPARGRSPRADLVIGSFQGSSTSRSFVVNWARVNHRAGFSFSLCVTLAPKPTLKSLPPIHMRCRMPASLRAAATTAHNMLDRLAIRRPRARNADHFLRRSRRLQAPTWKMRTAAVRRRWCSGTVPICVAAAIIPTVSALHIRDGSWERSQMRHGSVRPCR